MYRVILAHSRTKTTTTRHNAFLAMRDDIRITPTLLRVIFVPEGITTKIEACYTVILGKRQCVPSKNGSVRKKAIRTALHAQTSCGNVPNLAYDQGGQELDTSACGCRASSLTSARFRPLPAPPRTLVCYPCSYSCPISALPSSIYVQIQKIVCTILLHLNRSEINPPSRKTSSSAPRS